MFIKLKRLQLLLIFAIFCSYSTVRAIELPEMGTSANTVLSPAEERILGEAFIRQLRLQIEVLDDSQINDYINALGNRLVSYSDTPEQTFHFFVVNESSINAFAVPGGYIGLHSGLILNSRSEDELASVIAHEIAHITQRHIARTLEAAQRFSLPSVAALIAAMVVGVNNPQIGQAAATAVMAGNAQLQINFTRKHEQEADRIGMQLLAQAGFDPASMPAFFQRLLTATRYYQGTVPEFLQTHPVTTDRIAEAQDRAKNYSQKPYVDSPLYHLMRAKLLVLTTDNHNKLIKKLEEMLADKRYRDERATRYALALALLADQQTKAVETQINWLLKHDEKRVMYQLLKAQLAWANQQPEQALEIYQQTLEIYPRDGSLILDYADKLLQHQKPEQAKTVLAKISAAKNPEYYRLLAQAHQKTDNPAEARLALTEYYYLKGQTQLALEQLKQARQLDDLDFYLTTRIEARYRALEAELKEEQQNE